MEEERRVVKIGLSEPTEENSRPLAVVEFVNESDVADIEDLDDTSPIYTFDEVEVIGEGNFPEGLRKITDRIENPPIDSIMNPRRPFQEVIDLYFLEDEGGEGAILVVETFVESSEETTIFEPPQNPERLN